MKYMQFQVSFAMGFLLRRVRADHDGGVGRPRHIPHPQGNNIKLDHHHNQSIEMIRLNHPCLHDDCYNL